MPKLKVIMNSPVLFLDIDGVLNHAEEGQDLYFDEFGAGKVPICQENLDCLLSILRQMPELKIVWCTSWRNYDEPTWRSLKNPRLFLEGIPEIRKRLLGRTPQRMSSEHWNDVHWWLMANKGTKSFAILDDLEYPRSYHGLAEHQVVCDPCKGLTEHDVEKCLEILRS